MMLSFFTIGGFVTQILVTVPLMLCIAVVLVASTSAGWASVVWSVCCATAVALWYGAAWSFREQVYGLRGENRSVLRMGLLWYHALFAAFVSFSLSDARHLMAPVVARVPDGNLYCNSVMLLVGVVFLCDVAVLARVSRERMGR